MKFQESRIVKGKFNSYRKGVNPLCLRLPSHCALTDLYPTQIPSFTSIFRRAHRRKPTARAAMESVEQTRNPSQGMRTRGRSHQILERQVPAHGLRWLWNTWFTNVMDLLRRIFQCSVRSCEIVGLEETSTFGSSIQPLT